MDKEETRRGYKRFKKECTLTFDGASRVSRRSCQYVSKVSSRIPGDAGKDGTRPVGGTDTKSLRHRGEVPW